MHICPSNSTDPPPCAGSGGNGCVSFDRQRHKRVGAPNGGDGGRGGNVLFTVQPHLADLGGLLTAQQLTAPRGENGAASNRRGKNGAGNASTSTTLRSCCCSCSRWGELTTIGGYECNVVLMILRRRSEHRSTSGHADYRIRQAEQLRGGRTHRSRAASCTARGLGT